MALSLPARFGPAVAPVPPSRPSQRAEDRYLRRAFWHHSRTFSLATRLLPRETQLPVATLYLYCRTVDTVADGRVRVVGTERALEELDQMRERLDATLNGHPPAIGPNVLLWRRLAEVHRQFELPARPLHQLIDGARWDLDGRPIRTEADLLAYSDLVAGSVGAAMLPFLAREDRDRTDLEAPARSLGNAMQITNILRDVGEDLRDLGRTYLPLADAPDRLFDADRAAYAARMESAMALAERLYDDGLPAIRSLRPGVQGGIRSAARMYREILNEVRAAGYDNLTRRAVVPLRRKLRVVLTDGYAARRDRLRASARRTA